MDTYYLQDSRFFLGNTVVWWAKDGGFTVDIGKAKSFTQEEAYAWHKVRDSDIPWPKVYIDEHTKPTVDLMDIERRDAERAIKASMSLLPKCVHCDDIITQMVCAQHQCDKWQTLQHQHQHTSQTPEAKEKQRE